MTNCNEKSQPSPAAGWNEAIEAAALTARGFNAAANSSAMQRFVNAGLIQEVYKRDAAIAEAIEALRHNAPPDSAAGKSKPAFLEGEDLGDALERVMGGGVIAGRLPIRAKSQPSALPDHGGADTGVGKREALLRLPGDNSFPDFTGCNSVAVLLALGIANILDDPRRPLADRELDAVKHAEVGLKPLLEAALSKPAPVAANASAEARLREECARLVDLNYRGVSCSAAQDIRCERVKEIDKELDALSAHSPASDCDKQECMGDASPCDPKDLQELLAKPSVLEPSDRTADVTVEVRKLAQRYIDCTTDDMPPEIKMPTVNELGDALCALLDAFTVGRR